MGRLLLTKFGIYVPGYLSIIPIHIVRILIVFT